MQRIKLSTDHSQQLELLINLYNVLKMRRDAYDNAMSVNHQERIEVWTTIGKVYNINPGEGWRYENGYIVKEEQAVSACQLN